MRTLYILFFCLLSFCAEGQIITTWAGGGSSSGIDGLGDGLHADSATIPDPIGGTFDKKGNYYVATSLSGNRIRKVDTNGIITSIAGTGNPGFSGDGGLAIQAKLDLSDAVIIDTSGNLYIADGGNSRIRKIDAVTGIISTIAGTDSTGYNGDNIPATQARLNGISDICFDKKGNLYIADGQNQRIRKVSPSGIITTFAGNGVYGFSGDGGPATSAQLWLPLGVASDDSGNIYISDRGNFRIRKVSNSGIISTYAGNGNQTYIGDGIPATTAQITPCKIRFGHLDNLYISDNLNNRIYEVDNAGVLHNIAGNGMTTGAIGDGGLANSAVIYGPSGVAFDNCGNLYIGQVNSPRIRKVTFDTSCHIHAAQSGSDTTKTAIATIPNPTNIKLYPNPTSDQLHIEVPATMHYRLLNMVGTTMQQGTLHTGNNEISMQYLPQGMYVLEMSSADVRVVRKVLKE